MALQCYLRPPGDGDRTAVIPLDPAAAEATGMAGLAVARAIPEAAQWYPPAVRRPLEHDMGGVLTDSRGLVLHVVVGNGSPYGWFDRADVKASSTWWVSKAGLVEQYVPAGRVAWAQAGGNSAWHSVETAGYPHEPLTDAQLDALAALYRWGAAWWGWPRQLAETPAGRGLGWHGMGGSAWGSHPDCPGLVRRGQRAEILGRAQTQTQTPTPLPEDTMPLTEDEIRAVGAEAAAATATLLWQRMQVPPDGAGANWHPPRQADAAAVLRRTYEMVGAMWADLGARISRVEAALPAGSAGPPTAAQIMAGLDEVRSPADLVAISGRSSALALARLTTPPVSPPPSEV